MQIVKKTTREMSQHARKMNKVVAANNILAL